jgi:hypothetical protein
MNLAIWLLAAVVVQISAIAIAIIISRKVN